MIYFISGTAILYCSVVVYLIYRAKTTDYVKLTSLPIFILLAWLAGYHYVDRLGKPIDGMPDYEFTYVYHISTSEYTELWVKDENKESKLYKFPYNKDNEQKMKKAQDASKKGQPITGKVTKDDEGGFEFNFKSQKGLKIEDRFKK